MNIKYPSTCRFIMDGVLISPHDTIHPPLLIFNDNKKKKTNKNPLYTLIMFDPDAVGGNLIHWLVINTHTTIFPYKGPHPPPGTGLHHYHFLLLAQKDIITKPIRLKNRHIGIATLIEKLGLQSSRIVDQKYFVSHYYSIQKKKDDICLDLDRRKRVDKKK